MKRSLRAHPIALAVCGVLLVVGAVGVFAAVRALRVPEAVPVSQAVPEAPRLTPTAPGQIVYRIDPSRSTVGYEVQEVLAGASRTATGTTHGVAGDVLVDTTNLPASKAGPIVVNVSQLTSDEALRDARLQHDFLESATYPLATFTPTSVSGLPTSGSVAEGTDVPVTVQGDLQVKEKTSPVTVTGTVRRNGDELRLKASADVSLAKVGVGPISLLGFVSVDDAAKLTFDLVAVDASKATTPNAVAAPQPQNVATGTAPPGGSVPSFASAVQPVLEQRCAACHNSGGAGSQVWKLDTAGDAAKVASGLGLVTKSRFMPPWPASDLSVPFQHANRLTDAELAAVTGWAAAGGPLDVAADTPVKAPPVPGAPRADLDLKMAEPYTGSLDKRNDYRCFVLDPKLTQPTAITGYQFLPDKPEIVHHALAFKVKASAREKVDQRDRDEAGPGWECYAGIGTGGAGLSPGGSDASAAQFMAWAPGQSPITFPEGSGMPMDAGDFFVIQVHYHYGHATPADQSRMVFQTAPNPDQLDPVRYETYLAPAEIPCGPTESGPDCDRQKVIDQLEQEFGPQAPVIANGLHLVCRTTVDEVAKFDGSLTHVSCDHKVRRAGDVLAVFGHMHEIGKSFRMTLNPGTPEEKVLLDIPAWSFDWQMNYQLAQPVSLQKGDTIRVQCTWDRNLFKGDHPRYVTWAEGTEDEMCYSALTTRESR